MILGKSKKADSETNNRAIFFDRDGTLIVHRPYLCRPEEIELLPGVREVLHAAKRDGFTLFLFSNQSGVGRGLFTLEDVHRCNSRMFDLLEIPNGGFKEICIAPERPDQPSVYRKPSPRFISEMIVRHGLNSRKSWMVGDAKTDAEAGLAAGVRVALVGGNRPIKGSPMSVWHCRDIQDFYNRLQTE